MATRDQIVGESVQQAKDRRGRLTLVLLSILLLMMATLTAISGYYVYDTYHSAAQRGTNLAAQVRTACADGSIDPADAKVLCDRADKVVEEAPTAPTVKGDKGDTGDVGPSGPPPTPAQVAAAVQEYCASGACRGVVTPAQVQAAVRVYCGNHRLCKGPTGATGSTGQTGQQGPTGPTGPAGQDGKDGTNGTDAVPFTFTFVVNSGIPGQETTYNCTVSDPSTPATCTTS